MKDNQLNKLDNAPWPKLIREAEQQGELLAAVRVMRQALSDVIAERNELRERMRKLETIANAAREFLDTIELAERTGATVSMPPVQWEALYKLRDAVSKLSDQKHSS